MPTSTGISADPARNGSASEDTAPGAAPSPTPPKTLRCRVEWTLLTALVPAIWGTTYIATTHLLPEGHPLFSALMRALPAGIIAVILGRRLPHGSWWWKSLILGTLNMGLCFPLLFIAAQLLPGGVAATFGATQPLVVAFLTVPILHQKLSGWKVLWGLVGLVGVAMVVLGPNAGLNPMGIVAGITGPTSMAVGVVLTKRWGRPPGASSLSLAGWQLTAAGLVLLLPALIIDGIPPIDGKAALGYLWLGLFGTLITYPIWFAGINRLSVTATALLGLLSPLVATIFGTLFAGETLTAIQVAGFAVALTAMVVGQLNQPNRMAAKPDVPSIPRVDKTDVYR